MINHMTMLAQVERALERGNKNQYLKDARDS